MAPNKSSFLTYFVCLLVIMTNLSQMPIFVEGSMTQLISMPAWTLLAVYCFFAHRKPTLKAMSPAWGLFLFVMLFWGMMCMVDEAYARCALPYTIPIAIFVMIIGSCVCDELSEKDMNKIYACYIFSMVVVSYNVYTTYVVGAALFERSYLYASKNSVCQIILTAWVLILFSKLQVKKFVYRIGYLLIFIFFTFMIFVLQSRASIIGMPVALYFAVVSGKVSKKIRNYSLMLVAASTILLLNENVWEFISERILFAGRDTSDLNDLSSGRSDEWVHFLDDFSNGSLFGVGRCKRESIILTSLLELGLVGGIPLLILALTPLNFVRKSYRQLKSNTTFTILMVLAFVYALNGVFEQQAPFGPGVKCYFLWLLFGIVATRKYKNLI